LLASTIDNFVTKYTTRPISLAS